MTTSTMWRLRQSDPCGQGVLEVLAVIGLFGVLVAVGAPLYLGFQERRADKGARTSLIAAVPAAEAYREDHGSYAGMSAVVLVRIDPRVSPNLTVASARRGRYCLTVTVRGRTWSLAGPRRDRAQFSPGAWCA